MSRVYHINTVADYCKWRDYEVFHPQVAIVDFEKVSADKADLDDYDALRFECYAVFLKDQKNCKLKYGGKPYDFDEGTLVFVGPHQTVEITKEAGYVPKGYALLFHPDFLLGTALSGKMHQYGFFSYSVKEALHLSARERRMFLGVLEQVQYELELNLDRHSKNLIATNIELLLDYCLRFYDRQFLTRETAHRSTFTRFEKELNQYLRSELPQVYGLPSVGYFAAQLHLSANYFGDLVRKETGRSAQEYIHDRLLDLAKEKVYDPDKTFSEIAYELGFKYPQHFSRFFKQHLGLSPSEFRARD